MQKDSKGRMWVYQYDSMWASASTSFKFKGKIIQIPEGRTIRHEASIRWG